MTAAPRPKRLIPLLAALGLLAALSPTVATATPTPKPDLPLTQQDQTAAELTLTGQSEPVYTEFITESYEIPTRHGIIRGDVRRPVVPDGVAVPVILTSTPYSVLYQTLSPTRASRAHDATGSFFVPRGYARAVFDTVGTYGSEGCTDFGGLGERESGADVVEFLAAQPWSNGRVGMIGGSYDGTTAIAAAVEAPEHLVTIVPQVAIDRWYDYMYNDGINLTLEDNVGGLADPPIDSPADYDLVYGVVPPYHQLADDPQGVAGILADHATPCDRATNQMRGYETDPLYDDFWIERDYRALVDNVTASVLLEGAWLDDNVKHWATTRFFQALEARRPTDPDVEDTTPQTVMTIGQWSHSASQFSFAQDLRHAWFDHYLLGLDTGVTDHPKVVTEASNGIISAHDQWPPAEVTTQTLTATGPVTWVDANPAMVEQVISRRACTPACADFGLAGLIGPARIMGEPSLDVTITVDSTSTHVFATLYDVAPGGARTPISRGMLNTNMRHGLDQLVPLVPGEATAISFDLWPVDHVLDTGHTLEVALSSTNATWGLSDTTRAVVTATDLVLQVPAVTG